MSKPLLQRDASLQRIAERRGPWDVAVIGGGATGMGIAVDAASRGYSVVLLEQHDFGKGTSSRSTKLVHGGVRYLQQGNVSLVMEALKERGLLLKNESAPKAFCLIEDETLREASLALVQASQGVAPSTGTVVDAVSELQVQLQPPSEAAQETLTGRSIVTSLPLTVAEALHWSCATQALSSVFRLMLVQPEAPLNSTSLSPTQKFDRSAQDAVPDTGSSVSMRNSPGAPMQVQVEPFAEL